MCYVVLSDIHANHTALEAVVKATDRVAAARKFYFLGDLLGYGPVIQAIHCLDWLRFHSHIYEENGPEEIRWVPGNHDEWAVTQLGKVREEAVATLLAQRATLELDRATDWAWFSDEVRAALADESRSLLTKTRDGKAGKLFLAFTHGGVTRDERRGGYLHPWAHATLRAHFASLRTMTDAETVILFCGHTHLPALIEIRNGDRQIVYCDIKYGQPIPLGPGEYIINPGSAGHPRDGDPRAAFVLFDPETRTVEFHRVAYDYQPVVDALRLERFTARQRHEAAARYLISLDAAKLEEERGTAVNPARPPKRLLKKYLQRVEQAYDRLIHEIETGAGGEEEQTYHTHVYRVPQWDLEAIPHTEDGIA